MFFHYVSSPLFFMFCSVMLEAVNTEGKFCSRYHGQDVFLKDEFHYLNAAIVGTYTVHDVFDCTFECLSNPSCQSLNLAATKQADGKLWCDLLSATKYNNLEVYKENASSHHFSIKTRRLSTPCQNGGTCVPNTRNCCNCKCKGNFVGKNCERAAVSCKDFYGKYRSNMSQLVTLTLDFKPTSVLCHLGDFGCGDGGWTPVMKIDGRRSTFHYDSSLWSNKETFNLAGGETGLDTQETKLPTYWNTSFSKICLGMKNGQQINFTVINKQASSLFSVIADGQHRPISLGRATWKTLIGAQASLQINCNREGFNAQSVGSFSRARIGYIANNEENCRTCDSRIGFGTGGNHDDSNTCGNEANGGDNGAKHIKAFGYILVQ